ncbi:CGNR zinc finger domain-containing protein [Prauserella muralis]|uniref:Uncharacterized protein n=1 Tax=Prauserella muralis TaxID=588067 RepID=A0A2V4AHT4_9PSEU|nr:CGNR zinc finger domain-containing protein [Prauserella muralis]PXY19468.1 hypothetical protein BAY60_32530 [Prauserella muralis]TWE29445.1 putative RNA-binding Zn ribbon-like protein [Prauserella muralis]
MSFPRSDAPGELRKLEEFCNSARFLSSEDSLITPASTALWLRERGLATAEPSRKEHEQLVAFRETLRDFLGGQRRAAAVPALNRLAKSTLSGIQWSAAGEPMLPPRKPGGTEGLIAALLGILFAAGVTGELGRLKTCRNPACRSVFYDRSPGQTGTWCSMDVCGARNKMRSYRSRHAG